MACHAGFDLDQTGILIAIDAGSDQCAPQRFHRSLIIDNGWATGTGSSLGIPVGSDFNRIGDDAENVRLLDTDPWGSTAVIWEARPDNVSGADGGWNGDRVPIDSTQTYRFSIWLYRTVLGNGSYYFGTYGYNSSNSNTGLHRTTYYESVDTYTLTSGGSGYTVADIIVAVGGSGGAAQFIVDTIDGGGAITALHLRSVTSYAGSYTTTPSSVTFTGGTGTGATMDYDTIKETVWTNHYFRSGGASGVIDSAWTLLVAHILPSDTTRSGQTHADSGTYTLSGGKISSSSTEAIWQSLHTQTLLRSYLYYSTNTATRQQFYKPRVDECDGTEPTIQELLDNGPGIAKMLGTSTDCNIIGARKESDYFHFNLDQSINLPNDIGYTANFTALAWFKSTGTPAGGYYIIFGGEELEISVTSAGVLRTGLYATTRQVSNHGSGLADANWHYIGMTFNGTTKESYIDGASVGTQGITGTLTTSFTDRQIGQYGGNNTYGGETDIATVHVWDRVLSTAEINKNFKKMSERFGI